MIGVGAAGDIEDDDGVPLLIDPVSDPIAAASRRPAASERRTQGMADPARILTKRAVEELPRGKRDCGRQALGEGPLRWWRDDQFIGFGRAQRD